MNLAGNSAVSLAWGPMHRPSSEQMQVQVVDGLAAVRAGVEDDAIAAA